jgi:hypothetical protein
VLSVGSIQPWSILKKTRRKLFVLKLTNNVNMRKMFIHMEMKEGIIKKELDPRELMIHDYVYLKKNGSEIKMFWM